MKPRIAGVVVVLAFFALFWGIFFQKKNIPGSRVRLMFLASDPGAELLTKAIDGLYGEFPALARSTVISVRAPSTSSVDRPLPEHDLLIAEVKASPWIQEHKALLQNERSTKLHSTIPYRRFALGRLGPGLSEESLADYGLERDRLIDPYWENGSPSQVKQLIAYLLYQYAGFKNLKFEPPSEPVNQGLIVYENGQPRIVQNWKEWETRIQPDLRRPKIAVLEYATRVRRETLNIPHAIAEEIERQGFQPVFIFATEASRAIETFLLDERGQRRVDAMISLHFKFSDNEASEILSKLDIPVINTIQIYGRTIDEWEQSTQGLTQAEVPWQLAVPELAGLIQPNIVGGVDNARSEISYRAIPERVRRIVGRAKQWIELRNTPPSQRRIAILYWNYPPGKQNVGASYLNVVRSLPIMTDSLRKQGFGVSGEILDDATRMEEWIVQRGRNIGRWAPGELDRLIEEGQIDRVPVSVYKEWFADLPKSFQKSVVDCWGQPEKADIMTREVEGELQFIIPTIHLGNLVFLPQPDRARTQNLEQLYHSQDLPPHHQYIATYLWLQKVFQANAIVHTGTHGTHEWLSGKEAGLSGNDPGEVLAGTLPILYPYIMDDVGEGTVAKRRGMAAIIDHLTPAMGDGGLSPELLAILNRLQEWHNTASSDPASAATLAEEIKEEVFRLGLDRDLQDRGWSKQEAEKADTVPRRMTALEDYIQQIRAQSIPYGLHTFGVSPQGDQLERFTDLIARGNEEDRRDTYRQNLIQSGTQELSRLAHGLIGGYIAPGPGNDPVRNPSALPTGKDFYSFDPRIIPTQHSEELGARMAEDLIQKLHTSNGSYPAKIALQVWGVETIRHYGVQEAQGLALLGVKTVRDDRGRIKDLVLIPRETLGRPRIDVVFHATSLYRDTFPVLIELLDRAVQLAAASPEEDNPIRSHSAGLEKELIAAGVDPNEAKKRSLIRIFAEPTGKHDSKIHAMTTASGSWDDEKQVGNQYIRRMGHGYGGGYWGVPMEREFRAALHGTQSIVHSRASQLYATLDNDDYFSYGGSIALGVRTVDGGSSPPFYVTDLRTPGQETHETLERFMGQEMRSRYLNPTFIKSLIEEGYAGARDIWKTTEYLWGWQVVYPEAVDSAKWKELYEVWLKDRYHLQTDRFFEENNPFARQAISARMLEAVRKGYWKAPQKIVNDLTQIYVEQVAQHGVSCDGLTCDNPDLQTYIEGIAEKVDGLNPAAISQWIAKVQEATGKRLDETLQKRIADRQAWHKPQSIEEIPQGSNPAEYHLAKPITGRVMEEIVKQDNRERPLVDRQNSWMTVIVAIYIICSFGLGLRGAGKR